MPVTPRSLRRRLHANPAAIKVGAGIIATTVGVTTAAWGVLFVVQPFKGNGARSDARPAEEPTIQEQLTDTLLAMVPSDMPADPGTTEMPSFAADGAGQLVASVVDSVNGSPNTVVAPAPGGGTSGGGNNGGLLFGGGNGPTWTPPGRDGGTQGLGVPSVSQVAPIEAPDLALDGQEDDPCAAPADDSADQPSAIDPHLPGIVPEEEQPTCEEPPADATTPEEQPPSRA